METVKSQNIELRSRMAWQERYGHFISAGFKDEQHPYPRYPAKIELGNQTIMANGESRSLKSGMAINVNIKERKRRIISVFSRRSLPRINSPAAINTFASPKSKSDRN
ncbi:MAG: hypothetical protein WBM44_00885 [Waterburya sp.]